MLLEGAMPVYSSRKPLLNGMPVFSNGIISLPFSVMLVKLMFVTPSKDMCVISRIPNFLKNFTI